MMYWTMLLWLLIVQQTKEAGGTRCDEDPTWANTAVLRSYCVSTSSGYTFRTTHCYTKKEYSSSRWVIERGGTSEANCKANAMFSSMRNPDCQKSNPPHGTICFDCCQEYHCHSDSHGCNEHDKMNPQYMPDFMKTGTAPTTKLPITSPVLTTKQQTTKPTTQLPTTTTPIPTTTTTIPTTTTPIPTTTTPIPTTPSTSTTTIGTTTTVVTTKQSPLTIQATTSTTVTTSAPVNGTKCLECVEDENHRCSSQDYVVCSGDRPYCLNEITYNSTGSWSKTYHRCGSRVECYWDYWIRTGNGTSCIQSQLCTYCCKDKSDTPCNLNSTVPKNLYRFDKKRTVHKCMVTDTHNAETTHDCTENEGMFCLNDVTYDTLQNNVLTVKKSCATEDKCKGEWLQSRKDPACITGNMTGVDGSQTGNQFLCHYCCESNSTTPCNLKPKPDQINLFIQPTTTIAPTTNATTITTIMTTTPTTIATTTPTSTTTATTTLATTTLASKVKCHTCGDPAFGIPCSYAEIHKTSASSLVDCGGQYSYCMTDVIHDARGNADIFKRCVTGRICDKEWITESADQDYCKRYGTVNYNGAYVCHFCCTTNGCNSGIMPNATTWYTKHN